MSLKLERKETECTAKAAKEGEIAAFYDRTHTPKGERQKELPPKTSDAGKQQSGINCIAGWWFLSISTHLEMEIE